MAGRFRFRLEVVRRIRRQAQEVQRRVVAESIRAAAVAEERINQLTQDLRHTVDLTREAHGTRTLDLVPLRRHQYYSGWLQRRILESDRELAERRADVDRERARLAEATKKLKVVEKLREKQWSRYMKDVQREEQAALDEVGAQGYLRRTHRQEGDTGEWS
ncbi:MAG: flagellar export protein FliJ [Planctomycetes bacterium]|nr:flagellar export protein FliJ [Planctomycetota bacterium]